MKKAQKPIADVASQPKQGPAKAKRTKKDETASASREPYELPPQYRPQLVQVDKAKDMSPDEQRKIDELASHKNNLEKAGDWPDLFFLWKAIKANEVGYMAVLQGRLKTKFEALTANVNDEAATIKEALDDLRRIQPVTLKGLQSSLATAGVQECQKCRYRHYILHGSPGVIHSLESIVEIVMNLKNAIGPDLHTMRYFRNNDEHVQAADRAVSRITKAVMALNDRSFTPKKHGNRDDFLFTNTHGVEFMAPLPWLAIEYARQLVEEHQRLPSKFEIRAKLASHYDELKEPKMEGVIKTIEDLRKAKRARDTFWADVYRKAGLSDLRKAAAWENDKKRRVKTPPPSPTC